MQFSAISYNFIDLPLPSDWLTSISARVQTRHLRQSGGLSKYHCNKPRGRTVFETTAELFVAVQVELWVRTHVMLFTHLSMRAELSGCWREVSCIADLVFHCFKSSLPHRTLLNKPAWIIESWIPFRRDSLQRYVSLPVLVRLTLSTSAG